MKRDQEGFFLSLDQAAEFFVLCEVKGLNTYEERMALLRDFVREKKAKYLRDVEQFMKDKDVLDLRTRKRKKL